eukprot:Gregarina_sp_Pseudo_9__734@NODE_146_length_3958_cov_19_482266_g134_i0_p1_GENE_NODE_146_length_3958_cov_19_482266_g134_i0NODE_146_length_3958_cov_19_482266_g134_i0_p1_ORF_typecomplete_len809_score239_92Peptidase_M41/PF01434_18/1_4e54AAA/PF00004_29/6_8e39AAA/PF00004_29/1_8e03AAA_lid_3/PF17862_1/1_3e15RuvB_N/PF05496_12/2e09RuvB_N/PF05496_12/1_1e03AAA_5/PF07728_14/1_7e05AAA_5/PF07728_14/3_3e02AAA_2/PF07724_14/5_9e06AAA_2/PF07724_14/3_5e03AAA_22/PF13401_6/0_0025AAA_22/PF13401_6/2_7e03AAA_16/PF13191_6
MWRASFCGPVSRQVFVSRRWPVSSLAAAFASGPSRFSQHNRVPSGRDEHRPLFDAAHKPPAKPSPSPSKPPSPPKWTPNPTPSFGGNQRQSHSQGGTLEIPFTSIVLILASVGFWLMSSAADEIENEVSFRYLLEELIPSGRVEKLEVVNRQFVRVYLAVSPEKETETETETAVCARRRPSPRPWHRRLVLDRRSPLCVHRSDLRPNMVCFEIGDACKLEELLQRALAAPSPSPSWLSWLSPAAPSPSLIPPIFYREEFDVVRALRSYVPTIVVASLALITISHPASLPHSSQLGGPVSHGSSPHERILKFGKATPVLGKDVPKITFADVAGLEPAKREVSEFVDFLKSPKKFIDLGAEIPKGALLVGPPGTGKTLLAKAVAGEASVPFYSMSGSDFIELFVGVGPSRIRDLFDRARRNAPAIVFIDEIDTIGRSRSAAGLPGNGGSDERESTLNALLVEMDGFTTRSGVVILGGTNRGDVLDPALTRPGRFDRRIALAKPTVKERKAIFEIHMKPIRLDNDLDADEVCKRLAALTPGMSGAEIKAVCNEAAINAARRDAPAVKMEDFEQAVERLIGGLRKSGDVLSPDMRRHVALHEAGHAVAGWFLDHADPVLKLSIVPRDSGNLGYTQVLPDEIHLAPKEEVLAKICVLLGGRASEKLFTSFVTTGAADDLRKATQLARSYMCHLGFDQELGLASYHNEKHGFVKSYSEQTARKIDKRIQEILSEQMEKCEQLLKSKEKEVFAVADLLLEQETISYIDLKNLLGHPPGPMKQAVREFVEALPSKAAKPKDQIIEDQGSPPQAPSV